jgi:hypothetical protein
VPAAAPAHSETENNGLSQAGSEPSAAASASAPTTFTVISRGDIYERSTLVSQARERLGGKTGGASAFAGAGYAPSSALRGCVFRVTGNTVPALVDTATYDGKPVYVIATSSRAWVVGRGCSATDPELITTVSLAGLPGNLSALGSV